MSVDAIRVVGFLAFFAVVYAIFYRPVMSIWERRSSTPGEGVAPSQEPALEADRPSGAGDAESDEASTPRIRWYRDRILLFAITSVFLLDQLTKYLVKSNLRLHESWPSEGFVRLTYGTNSGTAFGLFPNQTVFLIVSSLLAIGFIFYFYRAHATPSRLLRLAIGLQLGGAAGNLIDRLRYGSVVDFIDVGWWPVFNLADSSIVVGIGLLIAVTLAEPKSEPKRRKADDPAT
jgi:signal peptidase II